MRLTNDIRQNIAAKIMGNVPVINYKVLLFDLVQGIVVQHMDPKIRAVYEDETTRPLLNTRTCRIRLGNRSFYTQQINVNSYCGNHSGLRLNLDVNLEPRSVEHTKKGTLYYDVMQAVLKSGYAHKHFEQCDLLDSVNNRVKAALSSVTTTNRLFDVLEPEFHHLIPRDDDKKIQLPATAAPFADDLRKLGANLPTVSKAKTKRA